MGLTGGTRITATAATMATLGGLGLTLHGMWRDQLTCSLTGVVLVTIALAAIILTVIHSWITDTSIERTALAAAQRAAQAERTRHIAAQAALEGEQARLYRDLAADRAADAQRLKAERAAMESDFEESRAALAAEAMEILASWMVNGKVCPPEGHAGNLIQFPKPTQERERTPTPQPQPARSRAREHGVVGP
jgi:hypothetical protein